MKQYQFRVVNNGYLSNQITIDGPTKSIVLYLSDSELKEFYNEFRDVFKDVLQANKRD